MGDVVVHRNLSTEAKQAGDALAHEVGDTFIDWRSFAPTYQWQRIVQMVLDAPVEVRRALLDAQDAVPRKREEIAKDMLARRACEAEDERDQLRELLVSAEGYALANGADRPFACMFAEDAPQVAIIERAGCYPRNARREHPGRFFLNPPPDDALSADADADAEPEQCSECGGFGAIPSGLAKGTLQNCTRCHGTGEYPPPSLRHAEPSRAEGDAHTFAPVDTPDAVDPHTCHRCGEGRFHSSHLDPREGLDPDERLASDREGDEQPQSLNELSDEWGLCRPPCTKPAGHKGCCNADAMPGREGDDGRSRAMHAMWEGTAQRRRVSWDTLDLLLSDALDSYGVVTKEWHLERLGRVYRLAHDTLNRVHELQEALRRLNLHCTRGAGQPKPCGRCVSCQALAALEGADRA